MLSITFRVEPRIARRRVTERQSLRLTKVELPDHAFLPSVVVAARLTCVGDAQTRSSPSPKMKQGSRQMLIAFGDPRHAHRDR